MAVRLPTIADILDDYDDNDEIPDDLAALLMGESEVGYRPTPLSFDDLSRPWMKPCDRSAWSTFAEEFE